MRIIAALLALALAAPAIAHEREMIEAIGRGDLEAMRAELAGGVNPNGLDDPTPMATWLPVYYAAEAGRADMLATLVEHGADIDRRDRNGDRPMDWAARYGKTDIVRLLLGAGADPAQAGNRGTPLVQALEGGHYATAGLLLDTMKAQAGVGQAELDAALYVAAKGRDVDLARRLIAEGADPDGHAGYFGESALHGAALRSSTEMIELLVAAGADLEARMRDGETPLFIAAKYGQAATLRALLEAGAEPDARDGRSLTPLAAAVAYRHEPDWRIGFDDGTRTNAELASSTNVRAYRDYHAVASLLAERTSDLDGALAAAVWGGYGDAARRLVERGAHAGTARDVEGRWVLGGAAWHPGLEMFDLLLANGASIERQSVEALRYAAIMGRADIALRLLDAGVDPNGADSLGNTPLLHAAAEGRVGAATLLAGRSAEVEPTAIAEAMSARIDALVCLARRREMSRAWKPTEAIRAYVADLASRHDAVIAALDIEVPGGAAMLASAEANCDGYN